MATQNPFDMSALFASFDPQAIAKQLQDGFSGAAVPGIDTSSLVETQRKNMELLMTTNQAMLAGSQALIQRQAGMLQEAIAEVTNAAKTLTTSGNPSEVSAKQVELLQAAFEKALSNSNEISNMIRDTQDSVANKVNTRIAESLQELKETISKVK
jgi:phasin family protein